MDFNVAREADQYFLPYLYFVKSSYHELLKVNVCHSFHSKIIIRNGNPFIFLVEHYYLLVEQSKIYVPFTYSRLTLQAMKLRKLMI